MLANKKKYSHSEPLYKKLEVLKIADLCYIEQVRFSEMSRSKSGPKAFWKCFQQHETIRQRKSKLKNRKISILPVLDSKTLDVIAESWNNTVEAVIECKPNTLKRKLKKEFLDSYTADCKIKGCTLCALNI